MYSKKKIGIALGSGSARGVSHIGVLNALKELGIEPDIVCGTSMGAIIGAAYINENLDNLVEGLGKLSEYEILKFFNIGFKPGLIDRKRFKIFFDKYVGDTNKNIQDLPKKYGCVATCYDTGKELDYIEGSLYKSIFGSIALPGVFPPFYYQDKFLIDGGVVNPVPVSLCKDLGADIVIAVDLNSILISETSESVKKTKSLSNEFFSHKAIDNLMQKFNLEVNKKEKIEYPNTMKTLSRTIDIMQYKITTDRLNEDKPDLVLEPKVADIGVIDFHKSDIAIKKGYETVMSLKSELLELVK